MDQKYYGFYVKSSDDQEIVCNMYGFDTLAALVADSVFAEQVGAHLPSVTVYSYSDFEDPQVEEVVDPVEWLFKEQLIAKIESPIYYDSDEGSSKVKVSLPSGRQYSVGLLDWDPVGDGEHLIMHSEWEHYEEELELSKRLKVWKDKEEN